MNPLVTEAHALCEGATEGPWARNIFDWADVGSAAAGHGICRVESCWEDSGFISRSRTLLPEMAAEIERLEVELSTEREKSRIMRPIVLDGQSAENFCHVVELSELREESQRLQAELDAANNLISRAAVWLDLHKSGGIDDVLREFAKHLAAMKEDANEV